MESPVFDTNLSSPIGAVRHDYLPTIQESACDQPTTDTFLTPSLPVFATMTTSTGGDPETEINEALLPSIKSDADTMVILSIPSPKTDDQQMLSEMGPSHIDTTINSVVLSSDDQVVGHSEEVHFGVTSSVNSLICLTCLFVSIEQYYLLLFRPRLIFLIISLSRPLVSRLLFRQK